VEYHFESSEDYSSATFVTSEDYEKESPQEEARLREVVDKSNVDIDLYSPLKVEGCWEHTVFVVAAADLGTTFDEGGLNSVLGKSHAMAYMAVALDNVVVLRVAENAVEVFAQSHSLEFAVFVVEY